MHGNVVAAHRLALCACDACAARAAPNMEEADVNELGAVEAVVVDLVHNDDFKVDAMPREKRVHERHEVHQLGGGVAKRHDHLHASLHEQ